MSKFQHFVFFKNVKNETKMRQKVVEIKMEEDVKTPLMMEQTFKIKNRPKNVRFKPQQGKL